MGDGLADGSLFFFSLSLSPLSPWPPPNALHPLLTVCPGALPPFPTDRPAAAPVSESDLGKGAAAAAVGEGRVASPRGCSSVPVMRLTVCSSEPPSAPHPSVCLFRAFPHCFCRSFPSPKTAKHTENRKTQTNSSVFIFFPCLFYFLLPVASLLLLHSPRCVCMAAAVSAPSCRSSLPFLSERAWVAAHPPYLLLFSTSRSAVSQTPPSSCASRWPRARSDPSAVGGCQFGADGPNGGVLPGKHADSDSCSLPLSC